MKILINIGNLLLAEALAEILSREPEGYRTRVAREVEELEEFHPDFIIVDCHTIRNSTCFPKPEPKTVLIDYGLGEEEMAALLLTRKVDGVMATTSDLSHLKKALRAIQEGQVWIDNRKIKALIQHAESAMALNHDNGFSRKEREIIILISRGLMNREIAQQLCISEQTVKTHISRIFRKANVSRRSQLVPLALKFQLPDSV
jgi:DNA-binding NarL/FixJ family response regulator